MITILGPDSLEIMVVQHNAATIESGKVTTGSLLILHTVPKLQHVWTSKLINHKLDLIIDIFTHFNRVPSRETLHH